MNPNPTPIGPSREFYLEQVRTCRTLARLRISPEHRAQFTRLALHWRRLARAWDVTIAHAA